MPTAPCPLCQRQFRDRRGLLGHIQFKHRDEDAELAAAMSSVRRNRAIALLEKVLMEDGDRLIPETKAAIALRIADLAK